ncbi:MAG TPA: DEAD/DEAH box helicase family protein [Gallionella sp.]|nr:DEAD/DEAH box helicase family protein [Gallionella sp.]
MTAQQNQLALAQQLTARTQALCLGLEDGDAEILELVTPATAELLKWWFVSDVCETRRINFHDGQKQAILNAIVAHEVLNAATLKDLYQQIAPEELLDGPRLAEVSQPKHAHPKYCLKMATGTGKTWVMQALMLWQLLNKTANPTDMRFTRQFLVVAPGLIVYDRLLDAFCGKLKDGVRDFSISDVARYAELFIPEPYREQVYGFVSGNVCTKEEIGLKATGNGMIAIANWHALAEAEEEEAEIEMDAPGATTEPHAVVNSLLPVMPGKSTGNSLEVLDQRYARGGLLDFLSDLPELLVFNDEAHHIHEIKKEGESSEVEWQKSLSRIAKSKGRRFIQVDFSATPYNDVGSGKNKRKVYFPHIVVDFDLKSAMRAGLVKSLVLDKRKELGALPLEFKAEVDDDGNRTLAEGQRVMLRAGLAKLRKLERDFAAIDPARYPKMLVVCEDTNVSPLVAHFLRDEGLNDDEVMEIHSGKKGELKPDEWAQVRERLFDVDRHAVPRVIVSVLMLREGFDVNNICVIVPLRASGAQILLEQTIGRGLRLMWRDEDYTDLKRENRERINKGKEPSSLIDILSIVEHPAFQSFYDDLMKDGLVGETTEDSDSTSSTGDLISVGLCEDYAEYDFAIPFILCEADEVMRHHLLDIAALPKFSGLTLPQLRDMLGKGDVFVSHDLLASTLFGDYRVNGAVLNVLGYNDLLGRLARRIAQALNQPLPKGNRIAANLANPYMQLNMAELAAALDGYIRSQLFGSNYAPMEEESWRVLLLQPVMDHIVKVFGSALHEAEHFDTVGEVEVMHRKLSEIGKLPMRESASLPVKKCIYPRLPYSRRNGGLEKAFMEWAQSDGGVEAFCKINEHKHDFVRLRYLKEEGLPAFYYPDFLVRTAGKVYLVETKAQGQLNHPNVQRKLKAATAWCERINGLDAGQRSEREWSYVLLGEAMFYEWRDKGGRMAEMLEFARVRRSGDVSAQAGLSF